MEGLLWLGTHVTIIGDLVRPRLSVVLGEGSLNEHLLTRQSVHGWLHLLVAHHGTLHHSAKWCCVHHCKVVLCASL